MNWFVVTTIFIVWLCWIVISALIEILHGDRKEYIKKVPYTRLVFETMYYTGGLLHQNGIKVYPQVDIKYYHSKKYLGIHCPEGRIVIYTQSHSSVIQIVNTVLHEVGHHFQMKTDSKEYKRYSDYQNQYGYEKNPCEIYARDFASLHQQPCLDFLLAKGIIVQV